MNYTVFCNCASRVTYLIKSHFSRNQTNGYYAGGAFVASMYSVNYSFNRIFEDRGEEGFFLGSAVLIGGSLIVQETWERREKIGAFMKSGLEKISKDNDKINEKSQIRETVK